MTAVNQKVAVITGASQGIGAALVQAYRKHSWAVVANSRSIRASDDAGVVTVAGDIADPAIARIVIDTAVRDFGRVDTLVNNAGTFIAKPFTDYTAEDYFAAQPETTPSVGVVTFNVQQRTLIESMLRDLGDDRIIAALDERGEGGLFVKNLENVQGDERDVILFSIAFSRNDRGYLPLNFGPLNRGGGERRLNVAVTRARRQIVLYCSFEPGELRAEETSSLGIKHLRSYLEFAATSSDRARTVSDGKEKPPDRHREQVAAALAARVLRCRPMSACPTSVST